MNDLLRQTLTAYPVDDRAVAYTIAFFSPKHTGKGQFYLMTFNDKADHHLNGGSTYRLNVPANAPVSQYWSATVYDRDTHALIRNMPWPSRSSQTPGLQKNADGSVDIYFGPKAPAGQGIELGTDKLGRQIRSTLPFLRAREVSVRQNVEAAGHRKDQLTLYAGPGSSAKGEQA